MQTPKIPAEVRDAIETILEYNWQDELDDIREHEGEIDATCHIFSSLVTLDNWINGRTKTVREYVEMIGS